VASTRDLEDTLRGKADKDPREPVYPKKFWHLAGMPVPKGGSSCSNCKFLKDDRVNCGEPNFIAWEGPGKPAGSPKIPGAIDAYCSIWFEPRR